LSLLACYEPDYPQAAIGGADWRAAQDMRPERRRRASFVGPPGEVGLGSVAWLGIRFLSDAP